MRPFRYRLQLLMDLREKAQETALSAYAGAMRLRLQQQRVSDSLESQIGGIGRQIQDRGQQRFPASMHSIYYTAMHEAKEQLKQSNVVLKERRGAEDEHRKEYLDRKSRHDVLQRLHDRKREEHFFYEFKAEEKMLEDLSNGRSAFSKPLTTHSNL